MGISRKGITSEQYKDWLFERAGSERQRAFRRMRTLARSAESEDTQLRANKAILDYLDQVDPVAKPQDSQVSVTINNYLTVLSSTSLGQGMLSYAATVTPEHIPASSTEPTLEISNDTNTLAEPEDA